MLKAIDGKKIAHEILESCRNVSAPKRKLTAFLIGDDGASKSFLRQKKKVAELLGVVFEIILLGASITEEEVIREIKARNDDDEVGGIIVQLPIPKSLDRDRVLGVIDPRKDPDNLSGNSNVLHPAVLTVQEILYKTDTDIQNKTVAVVGKGFLVGRPIYNWLEGRCEERILLDSKSNIADSHNADVVIAGTGRANLIDPSLMKHGSIIIDFGYGRDKQDKLTGDMDTSGDLSKVRFYTPTPGGTGPILVAMLFKNFYKLNT